MTDLWFAAVCGVPTGDEWEDCEDIGEVEGFIDANGKVFHWWSCNDAMWRGEYFDGMMERLGINILYGDESMDEILYRHVVDEL